MKQITDLKVFRISGEESEFSFKPLEMVSIYSAEEDFVCGAYGHEISVEFEFSTKLFPTLYLSDHFHFIE